jgi:flagellar M-ring protein FliF
MAAEPQRNFQSIIQRFSDLPASRKVGLAMVLAAAIAVMVGISMWAGAPTYKVLFSNLSEKDGGAVVATLQQMNVPYKTEAGGAILVPADQVYDLRFRLASQGLPKGGAVGFEILDTAKFGMTQFQEQVAYQRGLEGELARTIQALAAVEVARVHLAIPKPSVFVRDQQKPSASVMLSLYSGRALEPGQVTSIVHLVSSSVPELNPAQVTVVDQQGNLLTAKQDSASARGLNANQLDLAKQMEAYYAQRIEAIVTPIVGAHNVRAEVRADLDFSESELTSESYKPNPTPETQAIRSQQSMNDVNGGAGNAAGGVPGALTNQPPGAATAPLTNVPAGANAGAATGPGGAAAAAGGGSNRRESTTNFELDKTIRHVKEPLGRIKRLSVAVVVNYRAAKEADAKPAPLATQEMEQINNLVKEAMGYNQARGDTINVVNAAFTETKREDVELPLWKDPETIALAKELLKNLLIFGLAFYLVFGVLRPLLRDLMQPIEAATTPEGANFGLEGLEGGEGEAGGEGTGGGPGGAGGKHDAYEERLRAAREFAKQNPKVVAEIVKEWITKE